MMLQRPFHVGFALLLLGAASSCAPEPSATLRPAPAAKRVGVYKAVDNVADIYVETTVGKWPGDAQVLRYTTPLHVLLRNEGDSAVAIEYQYFELADRTGHQYAALPPLDIETAEGAPSRVKISNRLLNPLFTARAYQIHPMYGSVYDQFPQLETNRYRLGYSIDYHETNWPYWRDKGALPTREMFSHAIPQGVLQPGGEIEGYIFFEKVEPNAGVVTFRAEFVDAETGEWLARASIPFKTYPRSD